MKKMITKMLVAALALGLYSCESVEDRDDLPKITLAPSEIKISVTQDATNQNLVTMVNNTEDIIPYWSYSDAAGNDLGHSNQQTVTTTFPFAGVYTVNFTAYTRGGAVYAEPVKVTVTENNAEYFSAPEWNMLTNGETGKTWVLDMDSPIGWGGTEFPYGSQASTDTYWNWYPDYAGNPWVMPNKDWGVMRFDLDGNYNVSVTQTALATTDQATKTGTFTYDIANHKIVFNSGVEPLYGGDYHGDVSNWTTTEVVELTDTSLRLAVIRDQSRTGEGVAKIIFHYKPKP